MHEREGEKERDGEEAKIERSNVTEMETGGEETNPESMRDEIGERERGE